MSSPNYYCNVLSVANWILGLMVSLRKTLKNSNCAGNPQTVRGIWSKSYPKTFFLVVAFPAFSGISVTQVFFSAIPIKGPWCNYSPAANSTLAPQPTNSFILFIFQWASRSSTIGWIGYMTATTKASALRTEYNINIFFLYSLSWI